MNGKKGIVVVCRVCLAISILLIFPLLLMIWGTLDTLKRMHVIKVISDNGSFTAYDAFDC